MHSGSWKEILWDWRYRVETRGIQPTTAPHGVQYEPTSPGQFTRLMKRLPHSPQGRTFIDFGSGKGRVLLLALAYPFRRVMGVEYSAELHGAAERNLETYCGRRRCRDARSIRADARTFELAPGPLTLYFNNPFDAEVMSPVVQNIRRSLEADPREVSILCETRWTQTAIIEQIPGLGTIFKSVDSAVYHFA
jgi:SAM-dependent methyltransferase